MSDICKKFKDNLLLDKIPTDKTHIKNCNECNNFNIQLNNIKKSSVIVNEILNEKLESTYTISKIKADFEKTKNPSKFIKVKQQLVAAAVISILILIFSITIIRQNTEDDNRIEANFNLTETINHFKNNDIFLAKSQLNTNVNLVLQLLNTGFFNDRQIIDNNSNNTDSKDNENIDYLDSLPDLSNENSLPDDIILIAELISP